MFLNERLMSELRPTLFLAQLSNLLAGNISIVHGVTGSSRTFMGEESAGVDAVRIALARIASGRSEIVLVGGAHNGERLDVLLHREAGGQALKGDFAPVFQRSGRGGGLASGSLGAFLVLESAEHAAARGARPLARLTRVLSERTSRRPGQAQAMLERMWVEFEPSLAPGRFAILSGATGAEPATSEERRFLEAHPGVPVRATGTYIGHALDAQFPMNSGACDRGIVALPAVSFGRLRRGRRRAARADANRRHVGRLLAWRRHGADRSGALRKSSLRWHRGRVRIAVRP